MRERHARCGKPREASIERRVREHVVERELGQRRATQNARQRTILVELAADMDRTVFDSEVAHSSHEHLDERALVAIMPGCVTLKDARCYGLPIAAHAGLLPATITNSPGIR